MTLPVVNNKLTGWTPEGMIALADPPSCPFEVNDKIAHKAKKGRAVWEGDTLKFLKPKGDNDNYWYLPAIENKVSYCVIPSNLRGNVYVLSDQYGGCEYHVLKNDNLKLFAFLHVHRDGGRTVSYKRAQGWVEVCQIRSARIALDGGLSGSNLSLSWVRSGRVDNTFVHVQGNRPPLTVTVVNDGTAGY